MRPCMAASMLAKSAAVRPCPPAAALWQPRDQVELVALETHNPCREATGARATRKLATSLRHMHTGERTTWLADARCWQQQPLRKRQTNRASGHSIARTRSQKACQSEVLKCAASLDLRAGSSCHGEGTARTRPMAQPESRCAERRDSHPASSCQVRGPTPAALCKRQRRGSVGARDSAGRACAMSVCPLEALSLQPPHRPPPCAAGPALGPSADCSERPSALCSEPSCGAFRADSCCDYSEEQQTPAQASDPNRIARTSEYFMSILTSATVRAEPRTAEEIC